MSINLIRWSPGIRSEISVMLPRSVHMYTFLKKKKQQAESTMEADARERELPRPNIAINVQYTLNTKMAAQVRVIRSQDEKALFLSSHRVCCGESCWIWCRGGPNLPGVPSVQWYGRKPVGVSQCWARSFLLSLGRCWCHLQRYTTICWRGASNSPHKQGSRATHQR